MILLIDNYDSFSYNLYQMIGEMEPDIKVIRNDAMTAEEVLDMEPSAIILSPGPGRPADAGICEDVVKTCAGRIPILGVCLGHQAICEAFGGMIVHAKELMHGKQSDTRLSRWSLLFKGLPEKVKVARYHSLAVRPDTLPKSLRVSAVAEDGEIMAVEHERAPVFGLQFHPESIMTAEGAIILKNFLAIAESFPRKTKKETSYKEVQPYVPPVMKKEEKKGLFITKAVSELINEGALSPETGKKALSEITEQEAGDIQISSFLTAMSAKGITDDEILMTAEALRAGGGDIEHSPELMDLRYTSPYGVEFFDVFTAAAFVTAAAGIKVLQLADDAGHEGYSSEECYEKLGADITGGPAAAAAALSRANMAAIPVREGFGIFKGAVPARSHLSVNTLFDAAEAVLHPAFPAMRLMGARDQKKAERLLKLLASTGVKKAIVLSGQDGSGMLSLMAPTNIFELTDGNVSVHMVRPEDFGFKRCAKEEIAGGTPEKNAELIRAVLGGKKGAPLNAVILNAGAALHMARGISLADGIKEAQVIIESGRAKNTLEAFINAERSAVK